MNVKLAFDFASARSYDEDGRLRVSITNISIADVNEYLGREIPDFEKLGLDPNKIYRLLRDPEELAKAAQTFNGLPVIDAYEMTGVEHVHVSAESPKKEIVVGSTGSEACFEAPYLKNALSIWDAETIKGIEDESRKEISSSYYYDADMTPGTYEGKPYDGVMRNIRGNHVAIVRAGRAGPTVAVGDSLPPEMEKQTMGKKALSLKAAIVKGALQAAVAPKLAADAKLSAFDSILAGITNANWKTQKPKLIEAIKPKLAADADLDGIVALIDALDGENPEDNPAVDTDPPGNPQVTPADPVSALLESLKQKLTPEELQAVQQLLQKTAQDNPPPTDGTPKPPANDDDDDKDNVTQAAMDAALARVQAANKTAMDSAIAAATVAARDAAIKQMRAVNEAMQYIEPWVGKLSLACDSADEVYKAALTQLGVNLDGVHASAYKAILDAHQKPSQQRVTAVDSSVEAGFFKRFPNAVGASK